MTYKGRGPAISTMFVLLLALPWPAGAGAMATGPEAVQSGALLLQTRAGYRIATRLATDVEMSISGLVARVSVRQRFENTGDAWTEGVYAFPLPENAAVDRMRLVIGERVIEGEIRERADARNTYEQATADGRKASLVEQERPNLFTASVANIAPGETVVVEIEYLEDIDYRDGLFSLRFPLTSTPRYIPGEPLSGAGGSGRAADTNEVADASRISPPFVAGPSSQRVSIAIALDAGMPLDRITSRYHAVDVVESGTRYAVRLASVDAPMDRDFELVWAPVPSAAPRALCFTETIRGARHYLLMVMPPTTGREAPVPLPREMIFVVDTSGSMHGVSIAQAQQAVVRALDRLEPGDRFNVIGFDDRPRALYPRSADVAPGTLAAAGRFVADMRANGGTEMGPALELAFSSEPSPAHLRQIVFITDGAVGNEDALYSLIEQKLGPARLFTVGIGSAPNGWFMRKAAETGRGSFVMIGSQADVAKRMERLFEKIRNPQVTNIAIDWPGRVAVDAYPSVVPDLYLDEPVLVRARLSGPLPAGAALTVRGDSVTGAWQSEVPLGSVTQSAGVGVLWARARIGELMDEVRRSRDPAVARDAIIGTALAYTLVTRYTSLVAVDRTPARTPGEPLETEAVPVRLPHGQDMAAIFGFPATATGAAALRLAGLGLLFTALVLLYVMRHWSYLRVAAH